MVIVSDNRNSTTTKGPEFEILVDLRTSYNNFGLGCIEDDPVLRVVPKILIFFPHWEYSLIPFYGIIGGTKKKFKLLGYHLRVPQEP
jgi:hypothetical protein